MKRDGYTLSDYTDYYDFGHGKWSSRAGNGVLRIIPHHMAGNLSVAQFRSIMYGGRQMSPTYAIFTDGSVWCFVGEEMRPWTTGGWDADCCAITFEIANDGGAESGWHVSDKAYESFLTVAADICKRYGIDPVYTYRGRGINMHRDWASTACPGDYLYQKITSGQMTRDIRAKMSPAPQPQPTPSNVIYKVQCGAFKVKKNAEALKDQLNGKGFNAFIKEDGDYYRVQCGAFKQKANAQSLVSQLKAKGFKPIIKEEKIK